MCLSFFSCGRPAAIASEPITDFKAELAKEVFNNPKSGPIICYDDKSKEIVIYNLAMSKLLNVSENDLVKQPFDRIFCREESLKRRYRIEQISDDSNKIYVDLISTFSWKRAGVNLTIVSFHDVTARVAEEDQMLNSVRSKKGEHHKKKVSFLEVSAKGTEEKRELSSIKSSKEHHHKMLMRTDEVLTRADEQLNNALGIKKSPSHKA